MKLLEYLETQRNCECKSKQTEYFLFNKYLAVPEYIIEYEYVNKVIKSLEHKYFYKLDIYLLLLLAWLR